MMFHQKAIQNSWRQRIQRQANVVYLGASVGVQKGAGYISSKLNTTSSPELLSALAEIKLGFSLEVLTASRAVHAVDEPMGPGLSLGNEPESGPHAYEITDSLFVSLDDEAPPAGSNPDLSYKALQSSVCKRPTTSFEGPRDGAGSLNVPIGKPGRHGAGHGVNIVKSTKNAVRQVMFRTTDDVIFCPLEGTAMGLLSDMMKLGLDPEMITKVLDDALQRHNKTGAYKFKIEHVPCTRTGFCIDFQVGNTIMSTMAFATDHNGVLQVAFVARAPGTKNFGPIKDKIRAEVRDIEPIYPLGDFDVSHMNISGTVQETEGYKWGLTAHARKVITSRYRHPRGNTFVFTRARRSARSSRARAKQQVPGYVALQQYPGDGAATPSDQGSAVHVVQPSNPRVKVPSRLTEASGFDSHVTEESDITGGLVIKEIGVVRHERNKAIWAKKSVSNSSLSLSKSASRFKELKDDKKKKKASGEVASSQTEIPTSTDPSTLGSVVNAGVTSEDLSPLFLDTLAANLMGRALQSLLEQTFQGQDYDADESKHFFSDAEIKERADFLRQRDVRRAKGRQEKEAKAQQQARKAAKEMEAQYGVPPKYIPLRATGAHRDQIKAREVAAAPAPAKTQVSSALPPASRPSTTSTPTVDVKPASSPAAQPLDNVKQLGTGPVNMASAKRQSPDSIDRSTTASPVSLTANGRKVFIPGASNDPPAPPADPSPAEASMEEVLSDLEESGWLDVTRSEIIGLKHRGQSDIGSPGAFVKRSKDKGKGKAVSTNGGTTPSTAPARTTTTAATAPAPGSSRGVPSTAGAPKAQDKGKGKGKGKGKAGASTPASSVAVPASARATAPARPPTPGPSSPRKPARQSSPSRTTTNRRGVVTNANTAFRIGHPGLGTVARTMTTGTLDPITPHMPTEWLDEHVLAEALLNAIQQEALTLASEGLDSVTDARHPDELYPGASDYNFDIDDYCISRGGMDESEAERMELERYHRERTEEDRIMLENRERAQFELQLMIERAMEERHRLDRIAAEEQARARVNPFDDVLNEWADVEWPDELARCP